LTTGLFGHIVGLFLTKQPRSFDTLYAEMRALKAEGVNFLGPPLSLLLSRSSSSASSSSASSSSTYTPSEYARAARLAGLEAF
jgi:hypothetical protein